MSEKKPRQIRVGTLLIAGLLLFAVGATVSAAIVGATHHAPPSHVYTLPKATASEAPTDTPSASTPTTAPPADTSVVTTPDPTPATTTTVDQPAPGAASTTPAPETIDHGVGSPTLPVMAPVPPPADARPPKPTCGSGQAVWVDDAWVCP